MSQILLERLPVTLWGEHILIEDGKRTPYIFDDSTTADTFQYNTDRRIVLDAILAVRYRCSCHKPRLISITSVPGPINAWDWHIREISNVNQFLTVDRQYLCQILDMEFRFSLKAIKRMTHPTKMGIVAHAINAIDEFLKRYRS